MKKSLPKRIYLKINLLQVLLLYFLNLFIFKFNRISSTIESGLYDYWMKLYLKETSKIKALHRNSQNDDNIKAVGIHLISTALKLSFFILSSIMVFLLEITTFFIKFKFSNIDH